MRLRGVTASLVLAAAALSGCSGKDDEAASRTTERFYAAVEARDGDAACAQLERSTLEALVWLIQRGSPESKEPQHAGRESDERQKVGAHATSRSPRWARAGGLRTALYSNSLLIVMGTIWLLSWFGQSVTGRSSYNATLLEHHEDPISYLGYLGTADFWERTLQNWQSEFLAVASMAILSVYLRQRGSPESKPVGATHEATGATG